MAGQAKDLPAAFSGGMRQHVALVRTLLEDRPIVLLDEPFCALDAITRVRVQELAAELLAGQGVAPAASSFAELLRHHSVRDALEQERTRWSRRAPDDPTAAKVHEFFDLLLTLLGPEFAASGSEFSAANSSANSSAGSDPRDDVKPQTKVSREAAAGAPRRTPRRPRKPKDEVSR